MPMRELTVGATVQLPPAARADAAGEELAIYRVEHLLKLADGATLYTIKSEAEPFERVVAAADLDRR
jgi:hypothetical protein